MFQKKGVNCEVPKPVPAFQAQFDRQDHYPPYQGDYERRTEDLWQCLKNCDKESAYRVLRLQKRAARVISYTDRLTPSVALFNKLGWIPFYEQHKIDKRIIMYKQINEYLPNYLNEHLILNNKRHSRNTRYSSINAVCPKYSKETEGGRSFAVSATRLWNSIPIEIRKLDSIACFKKYMFAKIFKEQQCLHHFII